MSATQFDDLPLVTGEDEMRRVHRTPGLYLITRGGKAHDDMTCMHIADLVDEGKIVGDPRWRVASSAECRARSIPWCQSCCE